MEPTRRVTLKEAADILGVSKEAVRKRVIRGTLRSEKAPDGRVYVYLDAVGDAPPTHERDVLISQLTDEVAYLREESRRKDEIIMQQAITMRQLSAAAEESREDGPESPPSPGPPTPQDAQRGPQEGTEPRSWWQRMFGG